MCCVIELLRIFCLLHTKTEVTRDVSVLDFDKLPENYNYLSRIMPSVQ